MLIIDLNEKSHVKRPPKEPEIIFLTGQKPIKTQEKPTIPSKSDFRPEIPHSKDNNPVLPGNDPLSDEKERLLRQLSDEDARVRIERIKLHQKYFDLMTPELLPKPGADFSEIYDQMNVLNERLQLIWMKRQHVEKYGTLKKSDPVSKEDLTKLSALKHERSNAYKNLSKWSKKLEIATAKNSQSGISNAKAKIDEIELKVFDLSHQIHQLAERVKIAR